MCWRTTGLLQALEAELDLIHQQSCQVAFRNRLWTVVTVVTCIPLSLTFPTCSVPWHGQWRWLKSWDVGVFVIEVSCLERMAYGPTNKSLRGYDFGRVPGTPWCIEDWNQSVAKLHISLNWWAGAKNFFTIQLDALKHRLNPWLQDTLLQGWSCVAFVKYLTVPKIPGGFCNYSAKVWCSYCGIDPKQVLLQLSGWVGFPRVFG